MAWITRLLVIANRTADSDELAEALRSRAAEREISAMLVMPSPIGQEADAQRRLDRILSRLRAEGIEADGRLGDADPVNAALEAWDPMRFDEMVVCTLPPGESTWLHIDLPHRLRRMTDATVHHVVAQAPPERVSHRDAPEEARPAWFERLFPLSVRER